MAKLPTWPWSARSEAAATPDWSACPGCGVDLPEVAGTADPRTTASAACRRLYGEVCGYEYEHLARVGRFHQLTVDAYGAQHGGPSSPSIGTAFGLIGLHLALEEGWSGTKVRDAHQELARRFDDWPVFDRPATMTALTIFDVAIAGSPDAHAETVERWAAAVWASWAPAHGEVARLIAERLPGHAGDQRSGPR